MMIQTDPTQRASIRKNQHIQQRRMQTDPTQRASIRWDDHQTIRNQKRKPTDTTSERNQQPQTRDYQDTTAEQNTLIKSRNIAAKKYFRETSVFYWWRTHFDMNWATTAKKNQTSTTIDTMKDKWPTQEVDQDQLAINRQKTYIYFLRKRINGPCRLFLLRI